MSTTLATVADALIEFILSLLGDPETAAEFDEDPQAALANRGLSNVRPEDVCAVAPVIVERPGVVQHVHHVTPSPSPSPNPGPPDPPPSPVVREILNITKSFSWIDDRDTLIDQSTNQNIWAGGDVTQTFDQAAVVASGDGSMAAGEDIEQTLDNSTNIGNGASGEVYVGNDTTNVSVDGSFNQTDASTDTDVDVDVSESFNDSDATTQTTDASSSTVVEDSGNTDTQVNAQNQTTTQSQTNVADVNVAGGDATVVDPGTNAQATSAPQAAVAAAPAPAPEPEPEPESSEAFATEEAAFAEEPSDDDF